MNYVPYSIKQTFMVRLPQGEDLLAAVAAVVRETGVRLGVFSVIASFLRISRAVHPDVFDQPEEKLNFQQPDRDILCGDAYVHGSCNNPPSSPLGIKGGYRGVPLLLNGLEGFGVAGRAITYNI